MGIFDFLLTIGGEVAKRGISVKRLYFQEKMCYIPAGNREVGRERVKKRFFER